MICLKTEIELSRVILNGTTNRFLRHFFYTYIWLREPVPYVKFSEYLYRYVSLRENLYI